jgi:regulator-associated protein of mTOR
MVDARNNQAFAVIASDSSFFTEHLTAFELWLDFGDKGFEAPMHLPILLQVLLSQTHRLRALQLLRRYLTLGSYAVNLSLVVGIFPYVLKLLHSPVGEVRQLLVSIWSSILGFDPSCRQELVKDKMHPHFITYLLAREKDMPAAQRCMAAFVLSEICNGYKEGQQCCLQQGLHRTCTGILKSATETPVFSPVGSGRGSTPSEAQASDAYSSGGVKQWTSLCLYKLCEDFPYAKYLIITEASHSLLYPLLLDYDVTVRAAAVLALGELFGREEAIMLSCMYYLMSLSS